MIFVVVVAEAFCNCCRYQFGVETFRKILRLILEVDVVDEVCTRLLSDSKPSRAESRSYGKMRS